MYTTVGSFPPVAAGRPVPHAWAAGSGGVFGLAASTAQSSCPSSLWGEEGPDALNSKLPVCLKISCDKTLWPPARPIHPILFLNRTPSLSLLPPPLLAPPSPFLRLLHHTKPIINPTHEVGGTMAVAPRAGEHGVATCTLYVLGAGTTGSVARRARVWMAAERATSADAQRQRNALACIFVHCVPCPASPAFLSLSVCVSIVVGISQRPSSPAQRPRRGMLAPIAMQAGAAPSALKGLATDERTELVAAEKVTNWRKLLGMQVPRPPLGNYHHSDLGPGWGLSPCLLHRSSWPDHLFSPLRWWHGMSPSYALRSLPYHYTIPLPPLGGRRLPPPSRPGISKRAAGRHRRHVRPRECMGWTGRSSSGDCHVCLSSNGTTAQRAGHLAAIATGGVAAGNCDGCPQHTQGPALFLTKKLRSPSIWIVSGANQTEFTHQRMIGRTPSPLPCLGRALTLTPASQLDFCRAAEADPDMHATKGYSTPCCRAARRARDQQLNFLGREDAGESAALSCVTRHTRPFMGVPTSSHLEKDRDLTAISCAKNIYGVLNISPARTTVRLQVRDCAPAVWELTEVARWQRTSQLVGSGFGQRLAWKSRKKELTWPYVHVGEAGQADAKRRVGEGGPWMLLLWWAPHGLGRNSSAGTTHLFPPGVGPTGETRIELVRRPNHNGPIIDRDATGEGGRDGSGRQGPPWPLSPGWTTAPPTARSPSDGPGSPTLKMETTPPKPKKKKTLELRPPAGRVSSYGAVAPRLGLTGAAYSTLFSWGCLTDQPPPAGEPDHHHHPSPPSSLGARRKVRHPHHPCPWPAKREDATHRAPLNRLLIN
ncbi:hypothetical protein HU200_047783 [Digitaria exilis]|uniref:Uncharacterized protein n=1 Tax=Digitaria exilis TaxID=1010633 RepID=A0A835ATT3_9POAL|nr:hypothetical protein HU200_047783 [Digitaria exilis]